MTISCPCCGYETIGERGVYEICRICWWEDDGQDNENAHEAWGGPNGGKSLTDARYNFLVHGIYDPKRTDLLSKRDPVERYQHNRHFVLSQAEGLIKEIGTQWSGYYRPSSPENASSDKSIIPLTDGARRLIVTQRSDKLFSIAEEYYYRTEDNGCIIAEGWARLPDEGIFGTFELARQEALKIAKSR